MEHLIKLVRTYRLSTALTERQQLANEICSSIIQELKYFVFSRVCLPAAEDVMQETLKGIFTGLDKFEGRSNEEFWDWCYTIARHKVSDHLREKYNDRAQPMDDEELRELADLSMQAPAVSAADKMDVEDAMEALRKIKPECREYLWQHYGLRFKFTEMADHFNITADAVRMKVNRCLETIQSLVSRYA